MRTGRWKLHLSVAVVAIAAMVLALTPAVADPIPDTEAYPDVAFLARNDVPFDAQTAASMAAQLGAPIFITDPNVLSNAAADGIADLNPDVLIVAGGPVAISDAVANQAAAQCDPDCDVDRRFGTGRDETAAALAGIAADYGFDRPVLQGDNHVAGDVHVDGTVSTNALTIQDTAVVSGLNADRVDGMHANAINRVAYDFTDGVALDGTDGFAASTTITAPTDGFLVLSGSLDLVNFSTEDLVYCRFEIDGTVLGNNFGQRVDGTGTMTQTNMSLDGVRPVASGSHTVNIECLTVQPETEVNDPFLVVQFIPFGADGTQPSP